MNEKVVYSCLAFLTKTTPIDNGKTLPLKVTNHNNFTQGCRPSEEGNTRWNLHLPNALPWKKGSLSRL